MTPQAIVSEGRCPSCGAPVSFSVGSARVLVCAFCRTVVAREGEELYAEGKVAALAETQTPFRLGIEGRHGDAAFIFVGHLQKDYGDGVWDEWCLAFSDGRIAWLSESEGSLHLMFPRGEDPSLKLAQFRPGRETYFAGRRVVVEEVRRAEVSSAEGQLPGDLELGPTVAVDATGPGGVFITFDFGTRDRNPEIFAGRVVDLPSLGIPPSALVNREVKRVRLQAANCPQCNGALDFKAPDSTKRVGCPYCGALLDTATGKLRFLASLPDPERAPLLPLGSKGTLEGTEWTVIGLMQRSCTVEGVRYPWQEYLLWASGAGFCFLMESNRHWTHLRPLPAGEVRVSVGSAAYHGGVRYRAFQKVTAITETVRGEFYWKVRAGERAEATEYVAPPHSINVDASPDEVTYTRGTYLTPQQVQAAFKLPSPLPTPEGIAPSQPDPNSAKLVQTASWAMGYALLAVLIFTVMHVLVPGRVVVDQLIPVGRRNPIAETAPELENVFYSPSFTLDRRTNAEVRMSAPSLVNAWLGMEFDLVSESGEVISQYHELSYYRGFEDGIRWSEGRQSGSFFFSRLPEGTYSLRMTPSHDRLELPMDVRVEMETGVPRLLWLVLFLLAMGLTVAYRAARAMQFESKRWAESNLEDDE